MSAATSGSVDRTSADYRLGYAEGQANGQKWKSIAGMWGGFGLFLFLVLVFFAGPAYRMYNDHQIKHDKIVACSHATDVIACVKAVGE